MVDYQRVVDEIRSFVLSENQTLADSTKQLAAEYSEACKEVNNRLRRCEDFLSKGLRSEALHLAQAEPLLLEVVAALDFPERGRWDEVLLAYGLPAAPQLQLHTARALNEAYAAEKPLESLLKEHRRLALVKAPLAERLRVMRTIARLDPQNPTWIEDISAFETRRFDEIRSGARQAVSRNDIGAVGDFWEEMVHTEWTGAPPAQLVQEVEKLTKRNRQESLRKSLRTLETELNEAFAALDVETGKRLRARWVQQSSEADLPLSDPIWYRVSPALHWLAEHDKSQEKEKQLQLALERIEKCLNDRADVEGLKQIYFQVREGGQSLPPLVEERVKERIESHARGKLFRERFILAGTAASGAVLLVGFLVYMAIIQKSQGDAINRATHTVEKMLQTDDVEAARAFLTRLAKDEPNTAASQEVLEVQDKVEERQREHERLDQLRVAMARLENAPLERDEELVSRVRSLVRSPSEEKAFADLRKKRREAAVFQKLQSAQLDVERLERMSHHTPDHSDMIFMEQVQLELAQLNRQIEGANRELLESLLARFEIAKKVLQTKEENK